MKKKVLAVILTAVCTMGLMAGCGNSNVEIQTPRKMRPQQRTVIRLEFPSSQNMDHWTIAEKAF